MNTPGNEESNTLNPLRRMRIERRIALVLVVFFLTLYAAAHVAAGFLPVLSGPSSPAESQQDTAR